MLPYKKSVLGAQFIFEAPLDLRQIELLRQSIQGDENVVLTDTQIQLDFSRTFLTFLGQARNVLDISINLINYIKIYLENQGNIDIYINFFNVSSIKNEELSVYQKMLQHSINEYQLPFRVVIPDNPKLYYGIEFEGREDESLGNVVIDYGFSHLFVNFGINAFSKKTLRKIKEEFEATLTEELKKFGFTEDIKKHACLNCVKREEYGYSQLMIETINSASIPIAMLFKAARSVINNNNLTLVKSELISNITKSVMVESGRYLWQEQNNTKILNDREYTDFAFLSMLLENDETIFYDKCYHEWKNSLRNLSLTGFVETLEKHGDAPGGGSAAAYTGALACSIIIMVINTTISRKKFQHLRTSYLSFAEKIKKIGSLFIDSIELDSDALRRLLKELNEGNRESIVNEACQTPEELIKLSSSLFEEMIQIVQECSTSAISDLGVAAELALATANASLYNIMINRKFAPEIITETRVEESENLLKYISQMCEQVKEVVNMRINEDPN